MDYEVYIVDQAGNPVNDFDLIIRDGANAFLSEVIGNGETNDVLLQNYFDDFRDYPITVSAKGYQTKTLKFGDVPGLGGKIILQKSSSVVPLLLGAGLVAVIASGKKKKMGSAKTNETVKTVLLIGGGLIGFTLVKKLLEATGLWQGADTKTVLQQASDPNSYFSPNYWRQFSSFTYAINEDQAKALAKQIYDSFGFFSDYEENVIAAFKQLRTKANVSYLADIFNQVYGSDLLSFLRHGGGVLPWDGLSDSTIVLIMNYLNQLPAN